MKEKVPIPTSFHSFVTLHPPPSTHLPFYPAPHTGQHIPFLPSFPHPIPNPPLQPTAVANDSDWLRAMGAWHTFMQMLKPFDLDEFAKKAISPHKPNTYIAKKRIGRDGFNKRLVSTVDELKVGMTMQDTRALVLACGSGVGKTFGTSTARQGFQQQEMENGGKKRYEPVVAYIGFNCKSILSCGERSFLSDKTIDGESCVKVLVLSRLFAWLNGYKQLQSEKQQLGPTVLDIPDSDVQMQFILGEFWNSQMLRYEQLMTKEELKRVNVDDITTSVKEMLEDLGKQTPGLVLIVVVDEGQELDESRKDGARFALRCLRELQMDMMGVKEAVRVLPVCTEINPQTHLSDAREGKNISLSTREEALLSQEEFCQLVSDACKEVSEVSEDDIRFFAACAWPRARPVMWMQQGNDFTMCSDSSVSCWEKGMDVRRVLQAAADGTPLERDEVPVNMVRLVDQKGRQYPLIDYSVLKSTARKLRLSEYVGSVPGKVKLQQLTHDCHGFEAIAFRTVALFLYFFYHNRENNDFLPTQKSTEPLRKWCPPSVQRVVCVQKLGDSEPQSHPFNSQGSEDCKELSTEFFDSLEELCNTGDTILLHCGGSSAMDFILVTLEKGKTLHIRYADAKFKQNPTNDGGNMTQMTEMLTKAKKVHKALRKYLKEPKNLKKLENLKECSLARWNDDNFLLITNSQMEGDCVMSPLTTTWEPMTTLLYRSTGTEEADEDKAFPPSSLLSSRPVWPALLSRGSHVPNHMWKTPLPPTRAMMTRHMPFFRRICKLL